MSEGSNIAFSPPALPPFLQVVPAARVVLCLAHGGCYTRRNIARHNIARHLGEQHQLQRQVKKQALASLEAANIAANLKEAQHPAHGAEAISGLLLLDSFRCLHLRCGHSSVNVEQSSNTAFRRMGGGESTRLHRWRMRAGLRSLTDWPSCRRCSPRPSRGNTLKRTRPDPYSPLLWMRTPLRAAMKVRASATPLAPSGRESRRRGAGRAPPAHNGRQ